jgi:O-antigen/teichoic acid export membrane protein
MATVEHIDSCSEPDQPIGAARHTALNVASLLTTNVVYKATTFVTYVLVARCLGAHQFGQLALAVALLFSWHKFALVGLKTLLTREVARNRELTLPYFIHASVIGLLASILGIAVVVPFVKLMNYSPDTAKVIFLAFIGLPPLVLSQICEGVFQGWERMHLIAYVNVPINLLRVVAVFAALKLGYGIQSVVISLTALQFAVMLLQWIVLVASMGMPRIGFGLRTAATMVRSSSVFLGIQATMAIQVSLVVTVLSKLGGETSVGLYAAASQLLVPFTLLFNNVALALFPAMCRGYDLSVSHLAVVARRMMEGLMIIVLPGAVGLFMLAEPILMLIYQDAHFLVSAGVLRIIVWLLLAVVLTTVMGQALWASQREKLSLRITVINTVVQFASSVVLIAGFGLLGAAASVLLTSMINLVQHAIPVAQLFSGLRLARAAWKPAIASAAMAAFVVFGHDFNLALTIGTAAALYCLVLAGLFVWSAGGFNQFKAACVKLWTT